MKITGLFLLLGAASAGKPDISIGVNLDHDTAEGFLGAAVPTVTWDSEEESVAGLFDVQGGVESTLADMKSLPATTAWGVAKKSFFNDSAGTSLRADMEVNALESVDLTLDIDGFNEKAAVKVLGSAGIRSPSFGIGSVSGSASLDTPIGDISGSASYDLATGTPDGTLGFASDTTTVDVAVQDQTLKLSQVFGKNTIAPSVDAKNLAFGVAYSYDTHSAEVNAAPKTGEYGVSYSNDDIGTGATFAAETGEIGLTFSKGEMLDTGLTVSTKTGEVGVSSSLDFDEYGKLSASYKPDDSAGVGWTDGDWDASVAAPLEGWGFKAGGGVKLSLKRAFDISL